MYIPNWFREDNTAVLHELMRQFNFATLITTTEASPFATHLPFHIDTERGEYGTLRAHMARQNAQWQHFAEGQEALAIFQGAHAYISPAWYEAQPSVPTWNYAVVHAYGVPRVLEEEELYTLLRNLVAQHEPHPESLNMPEEHVRKQLRAIVGFEIEITRLEGKFKLSQNRSETDRQRVVAALREQDDPLASQVADMMANSPG